MNPDTRIAIRYAAWAASVIGCGFGGAKLWPKHPIAGAAIGILIVNPAIAVLRSMLCCLRQGRNNREDFSL